MKYRSEICEVMHQDAIADFKVGAISEARLREYDELCLTPEALQDKIAQGNNAHEAANIEHAGLVTA
jgi:DNA-binding transcriptional regulator YiaG